MYTQLKRTIGGGAKRKKELKRRMLVSSTGDHRVGLTNAPYRGNLNWKSCKSIMAELGTLSVRIAGRIVELTVSKKQLLGKGQRLGVKINRLRQLLVKVRTLRKQLEKEKAGNWQRFRPEARRVVSQARRLLE